MERKTKGIWIPLEVWEARDLSWNEKVLLMEVDSFTSVGDPCYFSDQYIADLLGVGISRAGQLVSSLCSKGYLRRAGFDGRHRYIETTISFTTLKDCGADPQKIAEQPRKKLGGRPAENYDQINTSNNTSNKENRDNKRFFPPTLEQVRDYCVSRGNNIDPQSFVDYYTANGWKVGRNPMKDWQAAVRQWEQRRKQETPNPRPFPRQQQESVYQRNARAFAEFERRLQMQQADEQ